MLLFSQYFIYQEYLKVEKHTIILTNNVKQIYYENTRSGNTTVNLVTQISYEKGNKHNVHGKLEY